MLRSKPNSNKASIKDKASTNLKSKTSLNTKLNITLVFTKKQVSFTMKKAEI